MATLRDALGARTIPTLLALQRRSESLEIVVPISLSNVTARGVVEAVRGGLRATWVIEHFDRVEVAVASAIENAAVSELAATIIAAGTSTTPPSVQPFIIFGSVAASKPMSVYVAARAIGRSERTVERQFREERLPPPRVVLGWCRLLHAAWHLDVMGRTPKQVVSALQFSSVPALYDLLRRYASLTPKQLIEVDGFGGLLRHVEAEVMSPRRQAGRKAERRPGS